MHPLHTTARHPKVSESQNGARSSFASFDRLPIWFSQGAASRINAAPCEIRLSSRSKLPKLERAPFWCIVPFYGCMCSAPAGRERPPLADPRRLPPPPKRARP
eukprot:COSAG01_NODE_2507_length_7552_cov_56.408560_9_plen_103_part_00